MTKKRGIPLLMTMDTSVLCWGWVKDWLSGMPNMEKV